MPKLGQTRAVPDKLIDQWVYKVKDIEIERLDYVEPEDGPVLRRDDPRTFDERYKRTKERVVNKVVTCKLYMVKRTETTEEPPQPLETVKLELHCPELKIKIEGTDVEALRAAMWSMLDKKFEIQWERFYQVHVSKPSIYGGDGSGLEIIYDDVYRGKTWDGKLLLKRWRGHEFHIDPWPGVFKDENGKVMACIPATEENQEALKEFCRRVDILRAKLADFLRPDVIQENLLRLAGCALLPAPEPSTPETT